MMDMSTSTQIPRTRRIVQVVDLTGPPPSPVPPPLASAKQPRTAVSSSTYASPSPSKKARHELPLDPLGEWANDLDVFAYRFETVVAEWKKSRGKLRDLEAARGPPPPSGPGKTNASSTANGNARKSAASINPFFLLLPPTAKISPSSLVLVFFAADHMLHSSPTGLAGAQRFVQVYEGGRHKAAQNQANGHGPGNGGSAVARQNAVMTELIYSALGWLGVKGGGLANVPPSVAGFVGTDHVEPTEDSVDDGEASRGRTPADVDGVQVDGDKAGPARATSSASNGHPAMPTQPPPPFPKATPAPASESPSSTGPPQAKATGLGARIRHIALSPTRLFRPTSSNSTSPTSPGTPISHSSSTGPSSSTPPPQPSSATLAAPLLSRSSSQSGILANPTTAQYQQHHRITSSPTSSLHSHGRPSSPLVPTPSAVAPPVLSAPASSVVSPPAEDEGLTARERVLLRRAKSNSPEAALGTVPLPLVPPTTTTTTFSPPPPPPSGQAPSASPELFASSLPSERPPAPEPPAAIPAAAAVSSSGRRSLLGRVHHRSARMLSASGITLPPLPGQPAPQAAGSSIFGDKFALPTSSTSTTTTSPPTPEGGINFFFTSFPTTSEVGGGGGGGGGGESEQSLMQAKKFRGAGAVRSGSGPVGGKKGTGGGVSGGGVEGAGGGGLPFPLAAGTTAAAGK